MIYDYQSLKTRIKSTQGRELTVHYKKAYSELYEKKPIEVLSYAYFTEIQTTGNRMRFEAQYFDRRRRLNYLLLLCIDDDAYITSLEELLNAICEETTWVLPAHCYLLGGGFNYNIIDLFSAETAFLLAETTWILKDKLSKDILWRVHAALKNRIVDIFEKYSVEAVDKATSNWASVVTCGVGATYLYAFPERFAAVKERLIFGMERYLRGISEDGSSSEGVAYWNYGFGFFVMFFDLLNNLTGEKHSILKEPKVLKTLEYINCAKMESEIYLPFADGGQKCFSVDLPISFVICNLFGADKCAPFDFNEALLSSLKLQSHHAYIPRLINALDLKNCKLAPQINNRYFPNAQIFVKKTDAYKLAVKCGYNNEMHNHNDIGGFQIVSKEKRLIADIGAGEYTKQYFSKERYSEEIFVCGAKAHSVPEIDGIIQEEGAYAGKVCEVNDNMFKMDIAGAYINPPQSYVRTFDCSDSLVTMTDELTDSTPRKITYRFISEHEPKIEKDSIRIENMLLSYDPELTKISVQKREYSTHRQTKQNKKGRVFVLDFTETNPQTSIKRTFTFSFNKDKVEKI